MLSVEWGKVETYSSEIGIESDCLSSLIELRRVCCLWKQQMQEWNDMNKTFPTEKWEPRRKFIPAFQYKQFDHEEAMKANLVEAF